MDKVPSITEAREVSCSYSNTNIFIFIQNSPSALKAAQTHTPALWQRMVQFKARKNNLGISHAIIRVKSLQTTYEVRVC